MPGARTGRSMPSACPPGSSSMNPREKVGGGEESACPMGGELDFDNLLFSQDRDDDEDPQRSLCVADHDETCKTLLTTDLPVEGRTLTERGHSFVGPSPSLTTASVEDLRAVRDTKETLGNYKVLDALSELAVTDEELRSSEDDLASDGCQQPSDGPGGGGPQHERREGVDAPGTARGGDARPRKKLSDFELLRVVGQGSFGKVFQVLEKSTQQVYAMKVMQKAHVLARNQSGYMKAERDILKAVRHPYIVTLRYSFQSPSKLYLILDFINGGHLFFQLYQQGTFSEELARFYTAEIVLAVQHLHALDIIHRDLKPENILLDHEGHLKVTDFGVAKPAMSDDACTNSMAGTMEYMAPEILLDKGHGKQADWWSVGVLLFEMLTGAPPFTHKNRQKLQEKIVKDKIKLPAFISPKAVSLLKGLLHKDPALRLQGSQVLTHPFFGGLNWTKLENRQLVPLFKPQVQDARCVRNFDEAFTKQPPHCSPSPGTASGGLDLHHDDFMGYSYEYTSTLVADMLAKSGLHGKG